MKNIDRAKAVIQKNWRNGFSVPTSRLYPFQWMWDSGFVALGTATYDTQMALTEIRKMFSGQWENGMVPHILFHNENETSYFPNFEFWNSNANPGAPISPKSSGITQPAVFGFVVREIFQKHYNNDDVKAFAKEVFPKIVAYHRFLYNYRDPFDEGLFYIFHPWESGRDNSPIWDDALNRIDIAPGSLPKYERRDTTIAPKDERPTQDQYDKYVYLLELGKKYKYDGKEIAQESPFLIQDNMMNAILIKSNESLIELAEDLKFDAVEIKEWQNLSTSNYDNKFWSDELDFYVGYDLRNQKKMPHKEIGGLVPLFANIPDAAKANYLNSYLQNLSERGFYLCPSFDVDSPLYDSKRYWRGPIWPQMNWMIYHGLVNNGFIDTANQVKHDLINLVDQHGFYEYFEAQKHIADAIDHGYGGNDFSWTASCYLHLCSESKK